jgi:RNA ligase (TIGR02306 family)
MESVKIKSIKKVKRPSKRYDITVEDNHNYFANGMLIHNCNARFCFRDNRLWVGSRTGVKAQCVRPDGTEGNLWWNVAKNIDLENKFKNLQLEPTVGTIPTWDLVLYGEVYGQVQRGFCYDTSNVSFRIFDTYSFVAKRYNNWDETVQIARMMDLPLVPELYRGPWKAELESLQNGPESVSGKSLHIREGFVVKPVVERQDSRIGRVIFKMVGTDYKLRKHK